MQTETYMKIHPTLAATEAFPSQDQHGAGGANSGSPGKEKRSPSSSSDLTSKKLCPLILARGKGDGKREEEGRRRRGEEKEAVER